MSDELMDCSKKFHGSRPASSKWQNLQTPKRNTVENTTVITLMSVTGSTWSIQSQESSGDNATAAR
ncbi:MAG: hypothetical protein JKP90_16480 [Desulfofustis sp. PB-SRB1]|nr:hypothetical protein [Desulfofustis sp. PB-SRB1]